MNNESLFKDISDADFVDEVQNAPGIVVIEFYRTSCGSCKTFEPVLNELAELYQGQVKFVRLNTDTSGSFHYRRLGVTGDPTTFVTYKGKVEGSFQGAAMAKYFLPAMADIFKNMAMRLGVPAPVAVPVK